MQDNTRDPGYRRKTAAKLLAEYDTLENILDNAEKSKCCWRKVKAGKELAIMSKKLATIITDVPVQFHEEDFKLKDWNRKKPFAKFLSTWSSERRQRILGSTRCQWPDRST
jgi:DNA polymerase-1